LLAAGAVSRRRQGLVYAAVLGLFAVVMVAVPALRFGDIAGEPEKEVLHYEEGMEMGAYRRSDRPEIRRDIEMIFDKFPVLRERRRQFGATLSGGEQQMLAIGRALMARPKLLMLDEPSLGLAPMLVKEIFRTIREFKREKRTILLVEQNAKKALQCADRGYVLETGAIVLAGSGEDLLKSEAVQAAYLGGRA
jgi:branched-chain amino acid transport system ATP-binding protein